MTKTNSDSIAKFNQPLSTMVRRKSADLVGLRFADVKKKVFEKKDECLSEGLNDRQIRLLKAVKRHGDDPSRHTEIARRPKDMERLGQKGLVNQSNGKFSLTPKGKKYLGDSDESTDVKSESLVLERAKRKSSKSERGIWYHGTTDKLLKPILSNGLIPNPKQRAWDKDDNTSYGQQSRASYGGIYLTQNLMTALGSARTARDKLGGSKKRELIIVMELQPRTFIADEDDLVFVLRRVPTPQGMAENEVTALYVYTAWKYGHLSSYAREDSGKLWRSSRDQYVNDTMEWIEKRMQKPIHTKLKTKVEKQLEKCWEKSVERNVSHFSSDYSWRGIYRNATSQDDAPSLPDKSKAEKDFANCVDSLTKLLKDTARPSVVPDKFNKTARVMQPIKYKGSNRIVAIVVIDETERDGEDGTTDFQKPALLKVYYGSLPDVFLSDYRKSVGDKFKVVKAKA